MATFNPMLAMPGYANVLPTLGAGFTPISVPAGIAATGDVAGVFQAVGSAQDLMNASLARDVAAAGVSSRQVANYLFADINGTGAAAGNRRNDGVRAAGVAGSTLSIVDTIRNPSVARFGKFIIGLIDLTPEQALVVNKTMFDVADNLVQDLVERFGKVNRAGLKEADLNGLLELAQKYLNQVTIISRLTACGDELNCKLQRLMADSYRAPMVGVIDNIRSLLRAVRCGDPGGDLARRAVASLETFAGPVRKYIFRGATYHLSSSRAGFVDAILRAMGGDDAMGSLAIKGKLTLCIFENTLEPVKTADSLFFWPLTSGITNEKVFRTIADILRWRFRFIPNRSYLNIDVDIGPFEIDPELNEYERRPVDTVDTVVRLMEVYPERRPCYVDMLKGLRPASIVQMLPTCKSESYLMGQAAKALYAGAVAGNDEFFTVIREREDIREQLRTDIAKKDVDKNAAEVWLRIAQYYDADEVYKVIHRSGERILEHDALGKAELAIVTEVLKRYDVRYSFKDAVENFEPNIELALTLLIGMGNESALALARESSAAIAAIQLCGKIREQRKLAIQALDMVGTVEANGAKRAILKK